MDCKVTCFDRVMHLVRPLPEKKFYEAVEIIQEYNFQDFLDFCVENGCFTEMQSNTLYDGIVMWEDLDGNYWEEDYDKLHDLYDAVGITNDVFEEYAKKEVLEISKMLTISTVHISKETAALLNENNLSIPVFNKGEHGWFVWVEDNNEVIPEDLSKAIDLAQNMDCEWLCLDTDGEILDHCLAVYEW